MARGGKIRVLFNDDGTTEVEVTGVKGRGCVVLTEGLERDLGVVTETRKTREYEERSTDVERDVARDVR